MSNMETMLLEVEGDHFFVGNDMTHAYFQRSFQTGDRHRRTFREADSLTLYEPMRSPKEAKNSGIHVQVGTTKAFKELARNILLWLEDWLFHTKTLMSI